jgi:hypothetical protein
MRCILFPLLISHPLDSIGLNTKSFQPCEELAPFLIAPILNVFSDIALGSAEDFLFSVHC